MQLITVRELFKNTEKYVDKEIEIGGWVRNKRPSKQFGFIVLNDGTYFTPIQVVYNDSIENFQEISKINVGAALIVKGTLVLTPNAKQPFEIQASSVTVEGPPPAIIPCSPRSTPWNSCAPFPICAPVQTPSKLFSVFALWRLWPSISSSKTVTLFTCTHP